MVLCRELELFYLAIKEDGYNGVCCFNTPLFAVFLDQNEFAYMLVSTDYTYDFLDHFKEMNFAKRKFSNRKFDLALIDIDQINIYPAQIPAVTSPPYIPSPDKTLVYSSSSNNRLLEQSNIFKREEGKYDLIFSEIELYSLLPNVR